MQILLIILATYLSIGLAISAFVIYTNWKDGDDITLGMLLVAIVRSPTWPLLIWVVLEDVIGKPICDIVLIKGSRYAKVEKILKDQA